jgi:hypothetical protein
MVMKVKQPISLRAVCLVRTAIWDVCEAPPVNVGVQHVSDDCTCEKGALQNTRYKRWRLEDLGVKM